MSLVTEHKMHEAKTDERKRKIIKITITDRDYNMPSLVKYKTNRKKISTNIEEPNDSINYFSLIFVEYCIQQLNSFNSNTILNYT